MTRLMVTGNVLAFLMLMTGTAFAIGALREGSDVPESAEARRYRLEAPLRSCMSNPDANTLQVVGCAGRATNEALVRIAGLMDRIALAPNPRPRALLEQAQQGWRRASAAHCQLYNLTPDDGDGARIDVEFCLLQLTLEREAALEIMAEQFESR